MCVQTSIFANVWSQIKLILVIFTHSRKQHECCNFPMTTAPHHILGMVSLLVSRNNMINVSQLAPCTSVFFTYFTSIIGSTLYR